MAEIIEAARLLWCPGLAQTTRRPRQSVQEWIASANFSPSVSGKSLLLEGLDSTDLLNSFGYDINRLSSAGSETLRNIQQIKEIPRSLAWPYVKLYYAALFYSHSLLRMWGRSPSYLRTSDLLHLRNTLNAYGITSPYSLSTGQFLIVSDPRQSRATLSADKGGGGTHEAIWRDVVHAIGDLQTAVAGSAFLSSDKSAITSLIEQATRLITRDGSNLAWLSYMRNEIHYRQAAGLWYPYTGRYRTSEITAEIERALAEGSEFKSLLGRPSDDLARFRAACLFLIVLARRTIADLANVSGSRSFLSFGQHSFETAFPARAVQ